MFTVIKPIVIKSWEDLVEQSWSGARDVLEELEEEGKEEQAFEFLQTMVDDLYPDGIDETTLNDYIWFELE